MKIVIQVVDNASVSVDNKILNKIEQGYLLFVGIEKEDNEQLIDKFAKKIVNMRINKDENDKTNLSILDINGKILSISQFTLCASLESRRPSFDNAAQPDFAKQMYEYFNNVLRTYGIEVYEGIFGQEMIVNLINHGPFTIYLDNNNL